MVLAKTTLRQFVIAAACVLVDRPACRVAGHQGRPSVGHLGRPLEDRLFLGVRRRLEGLRNRLLLEDHPDRHLSGDRRHYWEGRLLRVR